MFDFFEGYQVAFPWVGVLVFCCWVIGLFFIKRSLFRALHALAKKKHAHLHDIFIASADMPLTLLIVASGGWIIERLVIYSSSDPLYSNFHMVFLYLTHHFHAHF